MKHNGTRFSTAIRLKVALQKRNSGNGDVSVDFGKTNGIFTIFKIFRMIKKIVNCSQAFSKS
ncbi:MAG: hypothetical protein GX565_05635 [Lentisphaerae bacterium]|nr:hypothetical protein [Lentisphaerota bacterium]